MNAPCPICGTPMLVGVDPVTRGAVVYCPNPRCLIPKPAPEFDPGGVLAPGWNRVKNESGHDEILRSP